MLKKTGVIYQAEKERRMKEIRERLRPVRPTLSPDTERTYTMMGSRTQEKRTSSTSHSRGFRMRKKVIKKKWKPTDPPATEREPTPQEPISPREPTSPQEPFFLTEMMNEEEKSSTNRSKHAKTTSTKFPGLRKELPPLKRMTKKEIAQEAEERW